MSEPKQIRPEILALAERFGLSVRSVENWKLDRPMAEHARQTIVNRIKKVHEPHSDPIIVGRKFPAYGLGISETEDTISITIPKRPGEKMTPEQAVELLAVRRAGRKAS